jgi:hypothetical protein
MLNHPEATQQALQIFRSGSTFQWYVIPLLAFVIYIYFNEISKENWKGIAAGLSLYMVHWFFEIANALIQYFSGHALWTVPKGTAFLLLIGVGVELSLMFSVAGLVFSKILPACLLLVSAPADRYRHIPHIPRPQPSAPIPYFAVNISLTDKSGFPILRFRKSKF